MNKTAISAVTNRKIGGQAPSIYLPKLQKEAETSMEELRARVEQHQIDFDAMSADDFDTYISTRQGKLLGLIGTAMGKSVAEPATPVLPEDYELDEEEPTDEDADEEVA